MKVQVRFFDDKSDTVKYVGEKDFNVDLKFVRNPNENSADSLMTISGLVVPPRAEVTITLGIKKYLRQFELYPNDPSRGFNIMHMPLLYRAKTTNNQSQTNNWERMWAQAMLVQIPEPDFSMPFNVNAVTCGMLGILFINQFNVLVKPKRFF